MNATYSPHCIVISIVAKWIYVSFFCELKMAMLARQCVDEDPILRPDMKQVVISLSHILLSSVEWEAALAGNSQVFSGLVQGRWSLRYISNSSWVASCMSYAVYSLSSWVYLLPDQLYEWPHRREIRLLPVCHMRIFYLPECICYPIDYMGGHVQGKFVYDLYSLNLVTYMRCCFNNMIRISYAERLWFFPLKIIEFPF